MGRIGEEIVVSGAVEAVADGVVAAKLEARQGQTRLIRSAVAEARLAVDTGGADPSLLESGGC